WELTARIIPFGEIKSYSLKLNMKSTLLKDVKLERNRTVQPNVIL
ncbi:MAG: putative phosphatase, partial [Luteibaculaceae bacterium]